jgi:phage/plasmid-like protein (TIGR03299 family)
MTAIPTENPFYPVADTNIRLDRVSAFGTLGTEIPEGLTAAEVMKHAGLSGWNIRKRPAFTLDEEGRRVPMTGRFGVIRDVPGEERPAFLGDVGSAYSIVQNEDHISFLDTLVEEAGANYTNAGTMWGGKGVFIAMRLPGYMLIGGQDEVDMNLVAINTHNGSKSFMLMATPERVACANQLNVATRRASNVFKIRHTQGLEKSGLIEKAREALDLTFTYIDSAREEFERMAQTTLTQAKFEAIIQAEFGPTEDMAPAAVTRAENKIGQIQHLFAEAQTNDGIRDTVWAGFNALTEWSDHYAPTRGDDRDGSRATHALMGNAAKDRALELMLEQVPATHGVTLASTRL